MDISRRNLLSTVALGGTAAALAACNPATTATTTPAPGVTPAPGFDITKAASVVSVIASAAQTELPIIQSLFKGGAANTVAQITGYVGQLGTLAGSLASATATAAPSFGSQAIAAVGGIVSGLAGMTNLPSGVSQFVSYAQALIPVIQVAAGIASALGVPLAGAPSGISEQDALAGLIALTQKRAA